LTPEIVLNPMRRAEKRKAYAQRFYEHASARV
jgi:hypothetical protein